jgi:hypothetical protein
VWEAAGSVASHGTSFLQALSHQAGPIRGPDAYEIHGDYR